MPAKTLQWLANIAFSLGAVFYVVPFTSLIPERRVILGFLLLGMGLLALGGVLAHRAIVTAWFESLDEFANALMIVAPMLDAVFAEGRIGVQKGERTWRQFASCVHWPPRLSQYDIGTLASWERDVGGQLGEQEKRALLLARRVLQRVGSQNTEFPAARRVMRAKADMWAGLYRSLGFKPFFRENVLTQYVASLRMMAYLEIALAEGTRATMTKRAIWVKLADQWPQLR